ncbi:MAG: MetQ/NlpA family ABC transporter substrate-binding protein [Legionellaceae bacterium]|nr:MetQ/NlpA family ABC transporter substrate-binding protein [Legionellaceae bacterium]
MRFLAILALLLTLSACSKPNPNTLVIGTIAGPETELVEVAAAVAKKEYDLHVKIVEFSDYNLPNEALQDGSLDANVFQHEPYLKSASAAHGYQLKVIGKTFIFPHGIYSTKRKDLAELPDKAIIAIPNDPSNEQRALILLAKAGLIELKSQQNASLEDISANPRQFVFKEIDAAQLPRVLDDVDAAVINTTFAVPAGLSPSRDALFTEDRDSPYANVIVARRDNHKEQQLQNFVKAMQSEVVQEKAQQLFGNDAIAAWKAQNG